MEKLICDPFSFAAGPINEWTETVSKQVMDMLLKMVEPNMLLKDVAMPVVSRESFDDVLTGFQVLAR